ncbi:hypothetical protein EV641_110169 [Rhodococcus sp. SMB37]|uniref:hypothetical protein n=1 Tax=Rhodococcus sp. SMB37 TaxID=2512213 RepID=UPI0010E97B63|nr:hypothetical protein [Rhodococcus sp. SMB37]TCN51310.1 hypothetical protein EV641_110169 [Rhodococcus sp. SMB37]
MFISHASEDKELVAGPLAETAQAAVRLAASDPDTAAGELARIDDVRQIYF